ncbi:MAG TPA: hypothetical protein VJX74_17755 [Blastocatellia bacterium]|nr:hypothetical protein [Blastocatellia bacterium]
MQTGIRGLNTESDQDIFSIAPDSTFIARLAREIKDAAHEFARSPLAYLRAAFLPDHISDWLPLQFANALWTTAAHPLSFITGLFYRDLIAVGFIYPPAAHMSTFVVNAYSPTTERVKARDRFMPVLIASGSVHAALIIFLIYLTILNMFAPYTDVRLVNRPYRPFDAETVAQLYAGQRKLQASATDKVMSLEEIEERERKRREEVERRRREEEERKKAEQEKAEKEAQARAAKEAEDAAKKQNADTNSTKYGEINEAAIKDMVGKIYSLYKAGGIALEDFTVMASFKIDPDGSMPRSSIVLTKKSSDPQKNNFALQILWLIGESHALAPLAPLSSNSVEFELNGDKVSLTITGFAPTPEWAKQKASELKILFWVMSKAQKNSSAAELLSLVKINAMNNRMSLDLTVSRERASQIMRDQYGGNANNQPQ